MSHPTEADCVFCKIVAGKLPCFKLLEDETTIAFMDINPLNPGHALAVAKGHWPNVAAIPPAVLADVVRAAQRVARAVEKALAPEGINLHQANGAAAGQSVPHLHIHVVPRKVGDKIAFNWTPVAGDMKEIEAVAAKLKAAL
jgi:histidine triad (HIT) family protein